MTIPGQPLPTAGHDVENESRPFFWPPNLSFSVVFKETYRVKLLLVPLRLELCLRDACTLGLLCLLAYQVVNYVLAQAVFHSF